MSIIEKHSQMDPTIIAAQPGHKVATFFYLASKITKDLDPNSLDVYFVAIIAWSIRPRMGLFNAIPEGVVDYVDVIPITFEGLADDDNQYIVDPHGEWARPGGNILQSEHDARLDYIDIMSDR